MIPRVAVVTGANKGIGLAIGMLPVRAHFSFPQATHHHREP